MKRTNHAKYILDLFQLLLFGRQIIGGLLIISLILVVLIWKKDGFAVFFLISQAIFTLTTFLSFILGLPFLFIKSLRKYSGLCFAVTAHSLFASVWVWCVWISLAFAGVIWTIIGSLFFGIGVIGVALISSLIMGEFLIFFQLIVSLILLFGIQIWSGYLLRSFEQLAIESDVMDFVNQDVEIIDRLMKLKEQKLPLIKDAQLLPSTKKTILEILEHKERQCGKFDTLCISNDADYLLPILDEEFNRINGTNYFVEDFFIIDPEDKKNVSIINANYINSEELLDNDLFFNLWMKYS